MAGLISPKLSFSASRSPAGMSCSIVIGGIAWATTGPTSLANAAPRRAAMRMDSIAADFVHVRAPVGGRSTWRLVDKA